jgi:hypothetical protein
MMSRRQGRRREMSRRQGRRREPLGLSANAFHAFVIVAYLLPLAVVSIIPEDGMCPLFVFVPFTNK